MRLTEYLLWMIGLLCIGHVVYGKWQTTHAQEEAIRAFETRRDTLSGSARQIDQSLWSQERIELFQQAAGETKVPTAEAVLSIPSIELRVGVFDGTSERLLDLGAGRVKGTALFGDLGNLAIAGHRDGFFRGLKDVKVGDDIVIEHEFGNDRFVIVRTEVVDPDDISVLAPTDERTLTLITCYPFYFVGDAPQRYIVTAHWQQSD